MIQRGTSRHETFFLHGNGGAPVVSGNPSAFFGYMTSGGNTGGEGGVWVKWRWENGRFELRNDRFGFYPVFYFRKDGAFGVSDSIAELIKHGAPVSLDDSAISFFLRLGFYLGDDTPFTAIRALPPGARMRWGKDEGFCVESPEERHHEPGNAPPPRAAAIRRYGELFQAAMEGLLCAESDRTALPLSGGVDSRHILLALVRCRRPPDCCVTVRHVPPRPDEDASIASMVAGFFGMRHAVLPRIKNLFDAELRKNLLTSFCADEHAWLLPLRDFLRDGAFNISYDGIGGDVLSAGLFLNRDRLELYQYGKLEELAENILGPEGDLSEVLQPVFYRRWNRGLARTRLIAELEKHRGSANPIGQFYFWNRTRREIALSPWCLLNNSAHVLAPYLTGEVYDFLSALPATYFLDHRFHADALAAYYPEFARLPLETKKSPRARLGAGPAAAFALAMGHYSMRTAGRHNCTNRARFLLPLLARGIVSADLRTRLPRICNKMIYMMQLARFSADPLNCT